MLLGGCKTIYENDGDGNGGGDNGSGDGGVDGAVEAKTCDFTRFNDGHIVSYIGCTVSR